MIHCELSTFTFDAMNSLYVQFNIRSADLLFPGIFNLVSFRNCGLTDVIKQYPSTASVAPAQAADMPSQQSSVSLASGVAIPKAQDPDSIKRWHLTSIGNPIVEIRRSYDRLISSMGSYTGKTTSLYWIGALVTYAMFKQWLSAKTLYSEIPCIYLRSSKLPTEDPLQPSNGLYCMSH